MWAANSRLTEYEKVTDRIKDALKKKTAVWLCVVVDFLLEISLFSIRFQSNSPKNGIETIKPSMDFIAKWRRIVQFGEWSAFALPTKGKIITKPINVDYCKLS